MHPSTDDAARPPHRGSLRRKYALVIGALVVGALLASGAVNIYATYQENKSALIALQREKAEASARRIEQYVSDIEHRIAFTAPPGPGIGALDHRRAEVEALGRIPAITEIALLDAEGKEQFRASSLGPADDGLERRSWDKAVAGVKSGRPYRTYRSPVYFLHGAEPYMTIAMAVGVKEAGITVAEVDLEFLLEGISRIKVGKAGYAYAVDQRGLLIAHPDLNLVLKKTNLSGLPQIKAALAHASGAAAHAEGRDLSGRPVLAAYGAIPQLGWYVFVEQPQSEAFAPLHASLLRTGALLLAGLALSLLAGMVLARRMVAPIHALQRGVALIGSGALDHRIAIDTGDELEDLAEQFNRMASRLQESYAGLEEKVRLRTAELERACRALEEASLTDPLTGLRNRRFLLQELEADIALVLRRYDGWLNGGGSVPEPNMDMVFFMIDIDHFKAVNDRYGHASGDLVLSQMVLRLREVFRESDYLIRWGGEEFLVVARATDRADAGRLAERIRAAVAARGFALEDGTCLSKTCSVGFACFPFVPALPRLLSWTQVVELADRALYYSKHGGRNAWNGIVAADSAAGVDLFQCAMHDPDATVPECDVLVVSSASCSA